MNELLQFKVIENKEDEIDKKLSHVSIQIHDDGTFTLREERGLEEPMLNMKSLLDLYKYFKENLGENK